MHRLENKGLSSPSSLKILELNLRIDLTEKPRFTEFRTQCLNQHWFLSLEDSRELIDSWKYEYNWIRCHRSIGRIPPSVYAQRESERIWPPSAPTSNGSHCRLGNALRCRSNERPLPTAVSRCVGPEQKAIGDFHIASVIKKGDSPPLFYPK